MTEEELIRVLSSVPGSLKYGRAQLERGSEERTLHVQGYIELANPVNFNTMRQHFEETGAHIEARRGSPSDADKYCRKDPDLNSDDTPWEWTHGNPPKGAGARTDLERLAQLVVGGATVAAVATAEPAAYIRYHRGVQALKSALDCSTPRKLDKDAEVELHVGVSGSGKSHSAHERHPDAYTWTPGNGNWFDGYQGQDTVIFEEFNGQIPLNVMKAVMDRYACAVQVKGGSVQMKASKFIITSNYMPWEWYQNAAPEHLAPLQRRISQIWHYTAPWTPQQGHQRVEVQWAMQPAFVQTSGSTGACAMVNLLRPVDHESVE